MSKRTLIAFATVAAALAVAGPALAEPNTGTQPAKKGCEIQLKGPGAGQSVVYPHGYKFSVLAQDNKTHTYTCDDGSWKETVSLTAGLTTLRVSILSLSGGTLQAVRLA